MDLNNFKTKSQSEYANHKKIKPRLKKIKPKVLDEKFKDGHDRQFEKMDCLDCANCCKTTSPIFLQTDIDRLSKLLKMKSSVFISTYLHRDDEGDFVLQSSPCPFLGDDNKCFVYESRPKACREYPHTNRKNMHGILNLSLKNTLVCPAVFQIFQDFYKEFRK
ncbi:YkgJ family cysteine cluster protein [Echinicola jeungdonensis]|uniref:YkgJ family cysteine cluster protein n=1 Tax=Echinicola jeungdonensis TaxID=709343 RepID=A0ABV5J720_9BACT